jgi:sigma-54 specific flagellar transcriptional regulator A
LFQHFWKRHGEERPVTSAVMHRLAAYDWPGNVRELENLVERLSVCAQGRIIEMADLPAAFLNRDDGSVLDGMEGGAGLVSEISQELWPDLDGVPQPVSPPERSQLLDPPVRRGPVALAPEPSPGTSEPSTATPLPSTPVPCLAGSFSLPIDLPNLLRALEESYIKAALEQSGGNKKEAARLLGLGRTTLVEKLRRRATDVSAP